MKKLFLFLFAALLLFSVPAGAGNIINGVEWITGGNIVNSTITNPDLDGGTIDNTIIGGTTPAAVYASPAISKGPAASTLTGTADPTASTTLVGTGTLFLTELIVGDRITVNAEQRTVTAIASNTSLTVNTAFTDTAAAAVTRQPAQLVVKDESGNIDLIVDSSGNVGIGTTAPVGKSHTVLGTTTPALFGGDRIANLTGISISNANPSILTKDATIDDGVAVGDMCIVQSGTNATAGIYRVASVVANTSVTLDRQAATGACTNGVIDYAKDVVAIGTTDGTNGQRIMNYSAQNKPLQLGGDVLAATGHSLTSKDVLVGGDLEVNGDVYFDGKAYYSNNQYMAIDYGFVFYGANGTTLASYLSLANWGTDALYLYLGSGANSANNNLVIGTNAAAHDFDHGASTNPTIFIHSATDPDTDNTQWISFTHDQTDAAISAGLGGLDNLTAQITVGSGAGITVNSKGNMNRQVYKVTTTYAAFSDVDTTKGIVIATLPAKMKIVGFYADTTTKYLGGAINACTLEVGITAEGAAQIIAPHGVYAAAVLSGLADADMGTAMTRAAQIQGGYLPSWTGTTAIYATLDSTAGNLNALTQGSTTFYIETEQF